MNPIKVQRERKIFVARSQEKLLIRKFYVLKFLGLAEQQRQRNPTEKRASPCTCRVISVLLVKTLFTWSGGPRSSGVGFFCFHALADTKQKKPSPLDRGLPPPCKQGLILELSQRWHTGQWALGSLYEPTNFWFWTRWFKYKPSKLWHASQFNYEFFQLCYWNKHRLLFIVLFAISYTKQKKKRWWKMMLKDSLNAHNIGSDSV